MAERFLNPPQGPTALRAPRIDEGADVLGNIAGNDPGALGKIAQMLLKLREPAGLAMMGAGTPPVGKSPFTREALHWTGTNVRNPAGMQTLSPDQLQAAQVSTGKNTLMDFLQKLANFRRNKDVTDAISAARQQYPGGISPPRQAPASFLGEQERLSGPPLQLFNLTADVTGHPKGSTVSRETLERLGYVVPGRQALPASSFGKPGSVPTIPQVVPPIKPVVEEAANPRRIGRAPGSSSAIGGSRSVAGRTIDPRGAVLTQEEIRAIFKSMQPTVSPTPAPPAPSAPKPQGRRDPRIGRASEDAMKKRKE